MGGREKEVEEEGERERWVIQQDLEWRRNVCLRSADGCEKGLVDEV